MVEHQKNTVLDKYDLVIFFPCDWETPWREHYLIKSLSEQLKNSKILCVENPIDLVISFVKNRKQLIIQLNRKDHLRQVFENLYIYRPWVFLNAHISSKIGIFQKLNQKWLTIQLDKVLKKESFRMNSLIVWITDPFHEAYLGAMDSKMAVYDCYDDHSRQIHVPFFRPKSELLKKERKILEKVDVTFVVSKVLYKNKHFPGKTVRIVSNAVDTAHFGQTINVSTPVAKDIRGIPAPIIGFLGNLSDRIDFALLNFLARRNKRWSFVLIGGKERKDDYIKDKKLFLSFSQNSNVYLLGNKPYSQLPMYLKAFDVCLIPFREDYQFNLSSSPLKLYEYLATGKPIISTKIPEVLNFKAFIRIGKSKEDFENKIRKCLKEPYEFYKRRIKIASAHSWKRRSEEVICILEEKLKSV